MESTQNALIKEQPDIMETLHADPGFCWANRDETEIYYYTVNVTKDMGPFYYHQITLERAAEIVAEYQRKYGIVKDD